MGQSGQQGCQLSVAAVAGLGASGPSWGPRAEWGSSGPTSRCVGNLDHFREESSDLGKKIPAVESPERNVAAVQAGL